MIYPPPPPLLPPVLLRVLPLPLLSTLLTLLLTLYWSPMHFDHPYPYTTLSFVVSLTLTIRVRFSYDRYMNYVRGVTGGVSKLSDAVSMFRSFSTDREATQRMAALCRK